MHILLVTPLYPPDIAGPAPYVKELATRLRKTHSVTVLAYGHIPETIPDVRIVTVEKRLPALVRMTLFTWKLIILQRNIDVMYVQNGPSVEVPFVLASFFSKIPSMVRLGDMIALTHATHSKFFRMILVTAMRCARTLIVPENIHEGMGEHIALPQFSNKCVRIPSPDTRPEILPFDAYPKDALAQYEASWKKHITTLVTCITSRA